MTDEKWLCFVIGQVLSNALKYTKSGGEIALYGDGNGLVIKDNGIGISPEDLPRIGEKGFTYNCRADKKSTGIGFICVKGFWHGSDTEYASSPRSARAQGCLLPSGKRG